MEMHIPKDSELSIKRGEWFYLIFDKEGHVSHNCKGHLDPVLPEGSVKAHHKTHHCAMQTGKVEVQFTAANPGISAHTILIGN
jgi:hypothetical protein